MLAAYIREPEATNTLQEVEGVLNQHLYIIKEEAETLQFLGVIDEAFQERVASLCLSIETLRLLIHDAAAGIDRFIHNTYRKWRTYHDLHQDILCLYTAKTLETMTRTPKLQKSSNFNVVRINTHHIDIHYRNEALIEVTPTPTTTTTTKTTKSPPALEIFATPQNREVVTLRMRELKERFIESQAKIRVYQAHYARLGNLERLENECTLLAYKMDEMIVTFVEQRVLTIQSDMNQVVACFRQMCLILAKECENTQQYVFNTVNRFIECSQTYQKLVAHLHLYNIETEEEAEMMMTTTTTIENVTHCSSMYFISETI